MLDLVCICDHTFFSGPITRKSTVLDLGANQGEFSRDIRDRYGCRVLAVEADPSIFSALSSEDSIQYVNHAIGGVDGEVQLLASSVPMASSIVAVPFEGTTSSVSVAGITLETLCQVYQIDRVDLLKVDIEGAEIAMFDTASDGFLRERIGQITIEFHDFCGLVTRADVNRIARRLRSLGYAEIRFCGTYDALYVNRKTAGVSLHSRWSAWGVAQLIRAKRIAKRVVRG